MKKKNQGFTLIELLAVIVILAIIALIAVPVILNIIDKANKSAFKDTAYGIIQAGEYYFAEKQLDLTGMKGEVAFNFPDDIGTLQIKGQLPTSGSMTVNSDGKVSLAVSNGRYCVSKGYDDTDVTITEDFEVCMLPPQVGSTVYFDPEKNEVCGTYSEENSLTGETEGCLKWYVYKIEDGKNYMILDHNTTAQTPWVSETDMPLVEIIIQATGQIIPVTLSNRLALDTQNWQVKSSVITPLDLIGTLPWYQNLTDKTGWQEKYMEAFELAMDEVNERIKQSDYETESEWMEAQVNYVINKGIAAPKYMYKDILEGYLAGTPTSLGYWTNEIDLDYGIIWAMMLYMMYPMDDPTTEILGVRPTIVIDSNYKSELKDSVADIELNTTSVSLMSGGTYQIEADVTSSNANTTLYYISNDTSVATVSSTGLITGVSVGNTTITILAIDGSNILSKTVEVTVKQSVTQINVSKTDIRMGIGSNQQIVATVLPENAAIKTLKYISNNEGVATVSETGVITGVSEGTTTITISTIDGSNISKTVNVTVSTIEYTEAVLNGAGPVLREGMIPVEISADGTVTKADRYEEWYNYSDKQWANAVLVNSGSRENYKKMKAGEAISESDILAYFVWIPRYRYKLWYTEAQDGDTALDTSKVHSIDIVFENKDTDKSDGTCGTNENPTNGCYLTHPAFTFGEEKLNGIWVGKFETGYNGATDAASARVVTADSSKVIIKPNTYSWRSMNVSNMFNTVFNMNDTTNNNNNVFGLKTDSDTHMMKNTEWGAVTYLTFSDYGKDSEVYVNSNSNGLTGCGAYSVTAGSSSYCSNGYGTKADNIYNQSTTGNISGIFDMSGGAWEYVMGYTTGANTAYGSSGFTSDTFPEAKYVDIYTSTSTNETQYSKRILGDATGEMGPFANHRGSWYNDEAYFAYSYSPWFERGGDADFNSDFDPKSGVANFDNSGGDGHYLASFRVVLV